MGGRYVITGVQLGMLKAYLEKDPAEVAKFDSVLRKVLLEEVNEILTDDEKFLGNVKEE